MSSEIDRLRQAARQDPAALVRLADTLVASGRSDEAVQACEAGLKRRPDDVPIKLALGRALSAAGRLEEAQRVLMDAVSRQHSPRPTQIVETDEPTTSPEARPEDEPPTGDWSAEEATRRARPSGSGSMPVARVDDATRSSGRVRVYTGPSNDTRETFDLDRVAQGLIGDADGVHADPSVWEAPPEPPDPSRLAWEAARARAFVWLWAGFATLVAGMVGGWVYKQKLRNRQIAQLVAEGDARAQKASWEGDTGAREQWAQALRLDPKSRGGFARVALAAARLTADQGEDSDAAAWAMLRRAEKEEKRKKDTDPRADREMRQARALLALARGEPCSDTLPEDGDIAARCALQHADVAGARKILADALASGGGDAAHLRELLALASLELGAGDLDAADSAYRRVLAVSPQQPRALVMRAVVAHERGEKTTLAHPEGRLGPTVEAWFQLQAGNLDDAKKGIVHDGRLALLYGRARLMEGKVGEAEQAMRVAERLDPNDGDVAVLDAEVAIAKGFEDKVVLALSAGGTMTPRRLAVLGRAQVLTGRYREGQSTLDAALARRPGDPTAVTYRAIARAHLGDANGAIRELDKAADSLRSPTPHYGLGLIYYDRHDLLHARSELEKATERNSESFRARALLGRVLRDLGKTKEALTALAEAERDAPALTTVHAALGRLYLDLGRWREARAQLRTVIDGGKATADDKLGYAEATLQLGFVADGEKAIKDALDAGALQPKVARLRLIAQSWKGPKEALAAARLIDKQRVGAGARDVQLAILDGDAWRRAGDLRRAADAYRSALFGDPLHANLGLGRVQLAANQLADAEVSYRAAVGAWEKGKSGLDDLTDARVGLGRTLLQKKAAADATAPLLAAVGEDPESPDARFWLGRAYADQGQPDKARPQLEKATELDDHFTDAWLLLGDMSRGSSKDKARAAYRKVLELDANGPPAKAAKKALAALK